MATYTWSIPVGKAITGSTYIKDTDNNISDTVDDLVDFVNGAGAHAGAGLTYDLVDNSTAQTIAGIKTFSAKPVFSAGLTGNVTGDVTGNVIGDVTGDLTGDAATLNGFTATEIFPSGIVCMWSGSIASIPAGWYLCDGANGTPNLQDRFIVGAGSGYAVGATGGSKDAIAVSHTHSFSGSSTTSTTGAHTHTVRGVPSGSYFANTSPGGDDYEYLGSNVTSSSNGNHSHTMSISGTTGSTGSSGTDANLPPYYALAYIMKS